VLLGAGDQLTPPFGGVTTAFRMIRALPAWMVLKPFVTVTTALCEGPTTAQPERAAGIATEDNARNKYLCRRRVSTGARTLRSIVPSVPNTEPQKLYAPCEWQDTVSQIFRDSPGRQGRWAPSKDDESRGFAHRRLMHSLMS
jgi:hypothetical protein